MAQASPAKSDVFAIDSLGSKTDGQNSPGFPEPTYQSALDLAILFYNPGFPSDVSDRLGGLGYAVTETVNPADLNQTNLQNFNVLWIAVDTDPASYASQTAEIQSWVADDGGGLVVCQPNIVSAIPVFPNGYEVSVYNIDIPGKEEAMIIDNTHPITQGLVNADLSGNYERVRREDIGNSWTILVVDAETPNDVCLLAAQYGKGRFVFNTHNFNSYVAYPGSDQYVVQLTDWAGSGKAGWETAYRHLFDVSSDLALLREYRDEVLSKKARGRRYKKLLYKNSEAALAVLLDNPELMDQLKALIYANKEAVEDVTLGYRGTIYNTKEIAAFLDAYAKKAPPRLRFLAKLVKRQMLKKQKNGRLFFGFRLE
jgi:hypothetical protein